MKNKCFHLFKLYLDVRNSLTRIYIKCPSRRVTVVDSSNWMTTFWYFDQLIRIILISSTLRPLLTAQTRTCTSYSATGMLTPWSPLYLAARQQRRWRASSVHPTSPSNPIGVWFTVLVLRLVWWEASAPLALLLRRLMYDVTFSVRAGNGGCQEIYREAASSNQWWVNSRGAAQHHGSHLDSTTARLCGLEEQLTYLTIRPSCCSQNQTGPGLQPGKGTNVMMLHPDLEPRAVVSVTVKRNISWLLSCLPFNKHFPVGKVLE